MRTVTVMLVVTSILLCGFIAVAQEEATPGAPTAPAVEGAPGPSNAPGTVEGAPGAETDTVTDTEEDEEGSGDDDSTDSNPPQTQVVRELVKERTIVVRQIASAQSAGNQAAVKRLQAELKNLNERIAAVEANPLGGTEGQRSMWRELHAAGVVSESHLRTRYGLQPASAPESEQDTMPARPAKGGAPMPLALQIVLGCIAVGGAVMAIIALAGRGNAVDVIDALLADDRATGERRVVSGRVGNARFKQTTEPANATPAPPLAPQQSAFPQAPLGVAYVPVQVTANPVVLNPAAPAPAAPAAPAQPAPVAPAPQAQQPVQVWFNNNLGPQPQARQPQAPQGPQQPAPAAQGAQPQPRQPRNQPRPQGPAPAPAAGQGQPPAAPAAPAGAPAPANP